MLVKNSKSCDFGVFRNTELFLDCAFVPLPGVLDRREFTSDCSLQLAIVTCYVPLWKNMFCCM